MNRTYLSSVERSERNVSIDNIARIAKGLKVEPWQLLKDDGNFLVCAQATQDFRCDAVFAQGRTGRHDLKNSLKRLEGVWKLAIVLRDGHGHDKGFFAHAMFFHLREILEPNFLKNLTTAGGSTFGPSDGHDTNLASMPPQLGLPASAASEF